MNRADAIRRGNEARSLQKAITWHLTHSSEALENAQAAAKLEGKGAWVTLTKGGNLLIELKDDLEPGELQWRTVVADDE